MTNTFQFEIITPERIFYNGPISSLVAPGTEGYFGVLANHAPLLARSSGGKLKIRETSNEERTFEVGSGIVEVLKNRVIFLTKKASQLEGAQVKTTRA